MEKPKDCQDIFLKKRLVKMVKILDAFFRLGKGFKNIVGGNKALTAAKVKQLLRRVAAGRRLFF